MDVKKQAYISFPMYFLYQSYEIDINIIPISPMRKQFLTCPKLSYWETVFEPRFGGFKSHKQSFKNQSL